MFGKKRQPPQEIEEYSDEESEALVEEVDPDYEPTDKQVKQYALDVLGMKLPEDESLLYLAREGLKAPIPANWVPYQSREGEIYYKHKITQEKIFDHPTDVEYKKKYDQQKEKMARKNLKSIGLKQQLSGGLGMAMAPLGKAGTLARPPIGSSLLPGPGLSNFSSETAQLIDNQSSLTFVVDETLVQKYQEELQQFEVQKQREWKQFQKDLQEEHERKIKRDRKQYEEEIQALKKGNGVSSATSEGRDHLHTQKERIQVNLQEANIQALTKQLELVERQEQNKLQQYIGIYEEDNKIKLRKIEDELRISYQEKCRKLQQKIRRQEEKEEEVQMRRKQLINEYKRQLEELSMGENERNQGGSKSSNKELQKLLQGAIQRELESIKNAYKNKIAAKEQELENQLGEMKKFFGIDKSQHLTALAAKKAKLKGISDSKIQSHKNKNLQKMQMEFQQRFEEDRKELVKKLLREAESNHEVKQKEIQASVALKKQSLEKNYKDKLCRQVENLYQSCQLERNQFQKSMNQRLSQVRMKFIEEINNSANHQGEKADTSLAYRFLLEEKQSQVANKEELIRNLERQKQLQSKQLQIIEFEAQLAEQFSKNGEAIPILKDKMKQYNILHRYQENNPQLQAYRRQLSRYQEKYRSDKQLLASIMQRIQKTSAYSLGSGKGLAGVGTLTKIYNSDVRKLRDNDDCIREMGRLIKIVENTFALGETTEENSNMQRLKEIAKTEYKEIDIRSELGLFTQNSEPLAEMAPPHKANTNSIQNIGGGAGNIESTLLEHSKFLRTVKNQLNRKLYQARYQTRF